MHTTNQSIIVSGGSRGLGLHLASTLLKQGNRVATFARSATPMMDQLSSTYGPSFRFSAMDAQDSQSVADFVRDTDRAFGAIDSLINNAAIGQDQLLIHCDLATIDRIIGVNIRAPIILTRTVLKYMFLQPAGGNVVNISSICGSRGYAGLSVYAASKGALDSFTRSMARELGERRIRINSVAPGFFESEMSSVLLPEQMQTIKRRTPTGELSNEENIMTVVDLLLSRTTNIHGQTIFVDGGITI
jgi:3-oxoacyl-[acyl-carrier protein] reductase